MFIKCFEPQNLPNCIGLSSPQLFVVIAGISPTKSFTVSKKPESIFRLHFGLQLSQCLVVLANTHIHPYTSSDCSKALLGSLFFQSVTVTFLFCHYQTADSSSSCSFLWPQSSSHFTSTLGIARGCLKNYQSFCPPGKWPSTGEVASKSAPALTVGQNLVEPPQFFPVLTIR